MISYQITTMFHGTTLYMRLIANGDEVSSFGYIRWKVSKTRYATSHADSSDMIVNIAANIVTFDQYGQSASIVSNSTVSLSPYEMYYITVIPTTGIADPALYLWKHIHVPSEVRRNNIGDLTVSKENYLQFPIYDRIISVAAHKDYYAFSKNRLMLAEEYTSVSQNG